MHKQKIITSTHKPITILVDDTQPNTLFSKFPKPIEHSTPIIKKEYEIEELANRVKQLEDKVNWLYSEMLKIKPYSYTDD